MADWQSRDFSVAEAAALSGLAAPDEELLAILGATVTGTAAVSTSVALSVPAVRNAVSVISESAATMSLTVKRKVGDEDVDVPDHPALKLLTGQANPWTSGYELIRDLVAQALTQRRRRPRMGKQTQRRACRDHPIRHWH